MEQTIYEEIQRMSLLSKYDNSKTLSEQKNVILKEANEEVFKKLFEKFPCVLNLKGIQYVDNASMEGVDFATSRYIIWNNDHYYPDGTKRGKNGLVKFTCNDPEFKTQTSAKIDASNAYYAKEADKAMAKYKNSATSVNAQTKKNVVKPVTIPTELKDENGVKLFQDWLDINAKNWAKGYKDGIINKGKNGGGYGKFGPRTQKAWTTYKDQYLKSKTEPATNTTTQPATTNTTPPTPTTTTTNTPKYGLSYQGIDGVFYDWNGTEYVAQS